jgi:hypothetical protein
MSSAMESSTANENHTQAGIPIILPFRAAAGGGADRPSGDRDRLVTLLAPMAR